VPWQGVLSAFDDIAQRCKEAGIPAVVAIFPWNERAPWSQYRYRSIHDRIARAARDRGLDAMDLLDAFGDQPSKRLRVQEGDSHPSPKGHRAAANALLSWVHDNLPGCDALRAPMP
jgi:lysophospholipase L1-like esterase